MLRRPTADTAEGAKRSDETDNVFGELSVKFDRFVDVLTTVADSRSLSRRAASAASSSFTSDGFARDPRRWLASSEREGSSHCEERRGLH